MRGSEDFARHSDCTLSDIFACNFLGEQIHETSVCASQSSFGTKNISLQVLWCPARSMKMFKPSKTSNYSNGHHQIQVQEYTNLESVNRRASRMWSRMLESYSPNIILMCIIFVTICSTLSGNSDLIIPKHFPCPLLAASDHRLLRLTSLEL